VEEASVNITKDSLDEKVGEKNIKNTKKEEIIT
jgi:hypothetical protein